MFVESNNDNPYALFWRIDRKKDKGYYIRLCLYSISKGKSKEIKERKSNTLKALKDFSKKYFENKNNIKLGAISNRGENEKEILILYFDENQVDSLIDLIPDFSREVAKEYAKKIFKQKQCYSFLTLTIYF